VLLTVVPLLIAWKLYQVMRTVTALIKDFREQFQPLADEVKELAGRATEVADDALDQAEGFIETVAGVRERAERMGLLAEVLEEDLERVTIRIFSAFSGMARFITSIFTRNSGRKT
jgi:hypothetical protein